MALDDETPTVHHTPEQMAAAREAASRQAEGRPLSWSPDAPDAGHVDARDLDGSEFPDVPEVVPVQEFVEYTGHPDGSFTVLVTMQRGTVAVSQTERGIGKRSDQIREVYEATYGVAALALVTLIDVDDDDTLDLDDDE